MMGYADRTWCASPNCRNECGRQFTDEERRKAILWWGSDDFPLITGYFCDKDGKAKRQDAGGVVGYERE